jgi:hypothetical protein
MTFYSGMIFVHVVSAFGIFAVLCLEAVALLHLRGAASVNEARGWADFISGLPAWTAASFLFLLFSGIYLIAEGVGWATAWPKVALGALVLIGPLGAASGQRMRAIRAVCSAEIPNEFDLWGKLRDPLLKFSMNIRVAVVVGIVLLMTAKPDLLESLAIVAASAILGAASTFLFWRREAASPVAGAEFRQ